MIGNYLISVLSTKIKYGLMIDVLPDHSGSHPIFYPIPNGIIRIIVALFIIIIALLLYWYTSGIPV